MNSSFLGAYKHVHIYLSIHLFPLFEYILFDNFLITNLFIHFISAFISGFIEVIDM